MLRSKTKPPIFHNYRASILILKYPFVKKSFVSNCLIPEFNFFFSNTSKVRQTFSIDQRNLIFDQKSIVSPTIIRTDLSLFMYVMVAKIRAIKRYDRLFNIGKFNKIKQLDRINYIRQVEYSITLVSILRYISRGKEVQNKISNDYNIFQYYIYIIVIVSRTRSKIRPIAYWNFNRLSKVGWAPIISQWRHVETFVKGQR